MTAFQALELEFNLKTPIFFLVMVEMSLCLKSSLVFTNQNMEGTCIMSFPVLDTKVKTHQN